MFIGNISLHCFPLSFFPHIYPSYENFWAFPAQSSLTKTNPAYREGFKFKIILVIFFFFDVVSKLFIARTVHNLMNESCIINCYVVPHPHHEWAHNVAAYIKSSQQSFFSADTVSFQSLWWGVFGPMKRDAKKTIKCNRSPNFWVTLKNMLCITYAYFSYDKLKFSAVNLFHKTHLIIL